MGRGSCHGGVCECQPGWTYFDCSIRAPLRSPLPDLHFPIPCSAHCRRLQGHVLPTALALACASTARAIAATASVGKTARRSAVPTIAPAAALASRTAAWASAAATLATAAQIAARPLVYQYRPAFSMTPPPHAPPPTVVLGGANCFGSRPRGHAAHMLASCSGVGLAPRSARNWRGCSVQIPAVTSNTL